MEGVKLGLSFPGAEVCQMAFYNISNFASGLIDTECLFLWSGLCSSLHGYSLVDKHDNKDYHAYQLGSRRITRR